MEQNVVLEMRDISKNFTGVRALSHVDFTLRKGEIHALMGENGAGKSTFIKVITGVHKAEEGEMFLNGQKVDFKGPKDAQEAGIAAVYQHPTSYPHLTVAENIFMGHEIIKHHMIQWKEMNQEANKYLGELDADFDATAEMGTLSVAQQQMVEIAKVLSTNAKIIILDEPTVGLDPAQMLEIRSLIRDLGKTHTVILSSHILSEVQAVCQQVLILSKGRLVAVGSPEELGETLNPGSRLRATAQGEPDTVLAAVRSVPGICKVELESAADGQVTFTAESEDAADRRAAVSRALTEAGCTVLALAAENRSLEEVFLALTEKTPEQNTPAEEEEN